MEVPGLEIINCQYKDNRKTSSQEERPEAGIWPWRRQARKSSIVKTKPIGKEGSRERAAGARNLAMEAQGPKVIDCQYKANKKTALPGGAAGSRNVAMETPGLEINNS